MNTDTSTGCMTKYEIVALYVKRPSKKSVNGWFRREVHSNVRLMEELELLGYRKTTRTLSAEMVNLVRRRGEFRE